MEGRESCVIRSSIICALHQTLLGVTKPIRIKRRGTQLHGRNQKQIKELVQNNCREEISWKTLVEMKEY
jgi:hypothetical protein